MQPSYNTGNKRTSDHLDSAQPRKKPFKAKNDGGRKGSKGDNRASHDRAGPKPVPAELRELGCKYTPGSKFCFNFNMRAGCNQKADTCKKGAHKCMLCNGNHGAASGRC